MNILSILLHNISTTRIQVVNYTQFLSRCIRDKNEYFIHFII